MYESFADFYDILMTADYPTWIDSIAALLPMGNGIDLACGTGKFTIGLIKKGFRVTGVDISERMLNKAEENALLSGIKADFVRNDMLDFTPFKKQDFCICMCDGVNYLSNPRRLFSKVCGYLKKGGVFIFDISTEYRIKNILSGRTFSETCNDVTYIWHNNNLYGGRKLDMELTFFAPVGDKYVKREENQVMYLHNENTLKDILTGFGFSVKIKGESPTKPRKKDSERVHFICTKIKE